MRILITHAYGFANKGDWALLESLIASLRAAFPGAVLRGICRDPVAQVRYFPTVEWSQQVGTSFRKGLARRIENVTGLLAGVGRALSPLRPRVPGEGPRPVPECFVDADLIVACPGGYLEDSNFSILTNCLHLWFGLRTEAPVVLAPQSIGPLKHWFWKTLLSRLLKQAALICVREEISERLVRKELAIDPARIRLLTDMAFYDDTADHESARRIIAGLGLRQDEPFACATVVGWYFPFDADPRRSRQRYVEHFAAAIRKLRERHGLRTLLLKQIHSERADCGDDALIQEVHGLCADSSLCSFEHYPPAVMRGILSQAKVFLGSRMHSNIFALQTGTPVVAIAYLPKTTGIMALSGLIDFVQSISDMDSGSLLLKLEQAMRDSRRFKEAQQRLSVAAQRDKAVFIEELRRIASSKRTRSATTTLQPILNPREAAGGCN